MLSGGEVPRSDVEGSSNDLVFQEWGGEPFVDHFGLEETLEVVEVERTDLGEDLLLSVSDPTHAVGPDQLSALVFEDKSVFKEFAVAK